MYSVNSEFAAYHSKIVCTRTDSDVSEEVVSVLNNELTYRILLTKYFCHNTPVEAYLQGCPHKLLPLLTPHVQARHQEALF